MANRVSTSALVANSQINWTNSLVGILDGDSGSWVIDRDSFELYGYLIASDVFNGGYVICINDVLKDIQLHLDAKEIGLPSIPDFVAHEQSMAFRYLAEPAFDNSGALAMGIDFQGHHDFESPYDSVEPMQAETGGAKTRVDDLLKPPFHTPTACSLMPSSDSEQAATPFFSSSTMKKRRSKDVDSGYGSRDFIDDVITYGT